MTRARFVRRDASTLGFPGGDSEVAVTVLTPRIVRVAGPDGSGAGWWADARGCTGVRLPDPLALPVTVTLRT